MKLQKRTHLDGGSAPLSTSSFEIGDHGLVLSLIMKDMYSNPIRAICREVASNSRDAHREIGTPNRPIQIKLPTVLDRTIEFKDWGPGISPHRMEDIFTKVGRSTKREDNVETGGFGLGAKTPFAYISQFTITTTCKIQHQSDVDTLNLEGESYTLKEVKGKNLKCVYTASLGSGDSGAVKLHFAEITDEDTGTEISIAVKESDIEKFIENVLSSTEYWKVRPNTVNLVEPFKYKNEEITVSGNRWFIVKSDNYLTRKPLVIVDGIAYPLNIDHISCKDKKINHILLYCIIRNAIRFEFDTGELELTPNREELLYDDATNAKLERRLLDFISDFNHVLKDRVAKASSYKEAVEIMKSTSQINNSISNIDNIYWKGNKVYCRADELWFGGKPANKTYTRKGIKCIENNARLDTYFKYSGAPERTTKCAYDPSKPLVINDLGKCVNRSAVHKLAHKYRQFHILVAIDGDMDGYKKRIKDAYDLDVDSLEPLYLSDYLPKQTSSKKLVQKQRNKPQKGTSVVRILCEDRWDKKRISRNNDTGIYVILSDGNKLIKDKVEGRRVQGVSALGKMKKHFNIKDDIYGIKEELVPKLGPGFKPLSSVLDKELPKLIPSPSDRKRYADANATIKNFRKLNTNIIEMMRDLKIESGILNDFNQEFDKLSKLSKKHFDIFAAFSWVCEQPYEIKGENMKNFTHLIDKIEEKYPLLKHLADYYFGSEAPDYANNIQEYVQLIDEKHLSKIRKVG